MEKEKIKPLALKNKLYEDKIGLLEMIVAETDETKKETLKFALDLVNSYIDICEKRNKF